MFWIFIIPMYIHVLWNRENWITSSICVLKSCIEGLSGYSKKICINGNYHCSREDILSSPCLSLISTGLLFAQLKNIISDWCCANEWKHMAGHQVSWLPFQCSSHSTTTTHTRYLIYYNYYNKGLCIYIIISVLFKKKVKLWEINYHMQVKKLGLGGIRIQFQVFLAPKSELFLQFHTVC